MQAAAGRATPAGTARYAARFPQLPGHFRAPDGLALSSLALGMRNGEPGGVDDMLYREAVARCLEGGVNVFVTALSDRMQASERSLGAALERAFAGGGVRRDEIVVTTKGGFLTPDPELLQTPGRARRQLVETYLDTGLVDPDHVAEGVHCLDPPFLRDQIARSRRNLRVETIDLYLLEEPELQLRHCGPDGFRQTLRLALEALEAEVDAGHIGAFGFATWDGLLRPHTDRHHLSILDLFDWALEVGGADHHLRAIQLPYSLALGEALRLASQLVPPGGTAAVLRALRDTGTAVLAATPLVQGRALGRLPGFVADALPGLAGDAQRCLQFVRSTAGVSCAVVGMRDPEHLEQNLALPAHAPAAPADVEALFERAAGDERAA